MISIQTALEKVINESPFLEDGLYNGYLNLSSLSIYLKPKIENLTKKEITIGALKMALSRYTKEKQKTITYKKFSSNDFFIKKNIEIIYIEKNHETLQLLQNINSLGYFHSEDYFSVIQGGKNITLIFNENIKNLLNGKISEKHVQKHLKDLSLIGVNLDENNLNEIGIIYTITKKINFSNINIIEMISSYNEIHFIINQQDLKATIDAIVV